MPLTVAPQVTPAIAPALIPGVAVPDERCMCCWYVLHPHMPYPEAWSSTLCAGHVAWYEVKRLVRRAKRRQMEGGAA